MGGQAKPLKEMAKTQQNVVMGEKGQGSQPGNPKRQELDTQKGRKEDTLSMGPRKLK